MEVFFITTNLLFVLASAVLGTRLFFLWRRTRELPELFIGGSFLIGGVLSIVCWWVDGLSLLPEPYGDAVGVLGRIFTSGGVACILIVAWKVFRPKSPGAAVLVGYLLALLTANFIRELMPTPDPIVLDPLWWGSSAAQVFPYAWLCWESLRFHNLLRRRAKLGLPVDRLLTLRMRLWGIAMGAIALLHTAVGVGEGWSSAVGPTQLDAPVVGVAGLTCVVCLWLAFFTPKSWRRRLSTMPQREVA